ncbi:mechanosensitive ion channel family protein [Porticoccus litoralis]|jgi:small conductance mechanosensitive channel|uniref:Small-conductance mechanosensitive channel n=1 Tax=Porticoccus litoralis TaxID=434086 RepID=A0AAW8B2I7_9GAMM|nr:mechanosensitive ion channel domain-containing protein [Porticoccus litoralis]MDP1520141.1 mechanosensitive ion channel [Porticoccus litoralis]
METLGNMILYYGFKVLMAIVILVVGKYVAKWLSKTVETMMRKKEVDVAIQHFVSALVYYALLVFVVIAALGQVGIQTASFIAVIGAAGLAVGLALQGSLANFAAGVLILMFKPFRVGDFVEVAGVAGAVSKILVFTTELNTGDNKRVIIPNGQVMGGTITNFSANDTRRVDLIMGISYGDDIDKAKAVLQEVVSADERVLQDPAPTIAVVELADSSVNFVVRPWVNKADYWGVYFGLTEAVKKRFDQEGISIPFPQTDVHLHKVADNT